LIDPGEVWVLALLNNSFFLGGILEHLFVFFWNGINVFYIYAIAEERHGQEMF
jgi:hypothetical protein